MTALFERFFGEGFRVFFLAAGLYAVFSLGFWLIWLGVHWAGGMFTSLPFAMAPHIWHGHELVFGYGSAALGGFYVERRTPFSEYRTPCSRSMRARMSQARNRHTPSAGAGPASTVRFTAAICPSSSRHGWPPRSSSK